MTKQERFAHDNQKWLASIMVTDAELKATRAKTVHVCRFRFDFGADSTSYACECGSRWAKNNPTPRTSV